LLVTINSGDESGIEVAFFVIEEYMEAHTPLKVTANLEELDTTQSVVYLTPPFAEEKTIVGIPRVNLSIIPANPQVQIIAHLLEVDENQLGTVFTHAPMTLWDVVPGEETHVGFDLIFTSAHIPQGHRLALVIDTEDANYGKPTQEPFKFTISYDDSSYIQIPFVNSIQP